MAIFTTVIDGNINDGGTFGNTSPGVAGVDYPNPAGGDTASIAAGHDLTVNNTTLCTITAAQGLSDVDRTTLIITGALTLEANFEPVDWVDIYIAGGSSTGLDISTFSVLFDGHLQNIRLDFKGNSISDMCYVTGSGDIDRTANMISNFWYPKLQVDVQYCDWSISGSAKLQPDTTTDFFKFRDSEIHDFGHISYGVVTPILTENLDLGRNNYSDWVGTSDPAIFYQFNVTDATNYPISSNLYDFASKTAQVQLARNQYLDRCVTREAIIYSSSVFSWGIQNCLMYQPNNNPFESGVSDIKNNVFVINQDNGRSISLRGGDVSYNVYDNSSDVNTDPANTLFPSAGDCNFFNNILISSYNASFLSVTSPSAANIEAYNNTAVCSSIALQVDFAGIFLSQEGTGRFDGTVNTNSNIIMDPTAVVASRGYNITDSTADQIDTATNNCLSGIEIPYFGDPAAYTGTPGANDVTADPLFVDIAVNFKGFNSDSTDDAAFAEWAKINKSTYNPVYNIDDLLTYYRNGFTPTNSALQGTGLAGVDIGAMPVQQPGGITKTISVGRRRGVVLRPIIG